jgi:hypothetical protein
MPNPRTPVAKAKATGAAVSHPGRHRTRSDPKTRPLGKASPFLDEKQAEVWEAFKHELPWLTEADRTLVEVACNLRARLWTDPETGVQALAQLRMCVAAMGGTPADRSKVSVPDEEQDDPEARFFAAN